MSASQGSLRAADSSYRPSDYHYRRAVRLTIWAALSALFPLMLRVVIMIAPPQDARGAQIQQVGAAYTDLILLLTAGMSLRAVYDWVKSAVVEGHPASVAVTYALSIGFALYFFWDVFLSRLNFHF